MLNKISQAKASPAAAVLLLSCLLLFLARLTYVNFFAPPRPAPMDAQGRANRKVLIELGNKCGGNFSRLSASDQARARQLAGGYAAMAIAMLHKHPHMGD